MDNTIYQVGEICFSQGSIKQGAILHDKLVFFYNGFIVVSNSPDDQNPTWYNINQIIRMENVVPYTNSTNKAMRISL